MDLFVLNALLFGINLLNEKVLCPHLLPKIKYYASVPSNIWKK